MVLPVVSSADYVLRDLKTLGYADVVPAAECNMDVDAERAREADNKDSVVAASTDTHVFRDDKARLAALRFLACRVDPHFEAVASAEEASRLSPTQDLHVQSCCSEVERFWHALGVPPLHPHPHDTAVHAATVRKGALDASSRPRKPPRRPDAKRQLQAQAQLRSAIDITFAAVQRDYSTERRDVPEDVDADATRVALINDFYELFPNARPVLPDPRFKPAKRRPAAAQTHRQPPRRPHAPEPPRAQPRSDSVSGTARPRRAAEPVQTAHHGCPAAPPRAAEKSANQGREPLAVLAALKDGNIMLEQSPRRRLVGNSVSNECIASHNHTSRRPKPAAQESSDAAMSSKSATPDAQHLDSADGFKLLHLSRAIAMGIEDPHQQSPSAARPITPASTAALDALAASCESTAQAAAACARTDNNLLALAALSRPHAQPLVGGDGSPVKDHTAIMVAHTEQLRARRAATDARLHRHLHGAIDAHAHAVQVIQRVRRARAACATLHAAVQPLASDADADADADTHACAPPSLASSRDVATTEHAAAQSAQLAEYCTRTLRSSLESLR